MNNMMVRSGTALAVLLPLLAPVPSGAQTPLQPTVRGTIQPSPAPIRAGTSLVIEAGAGRVLPLSGNAASIFVADPHVAEVRPASPTSLFVFGLAPGRTTIAALDAAGNALLQYELTVRPSGFGAGEAEATLTRLGLGHELRIATTTRGMVVTGEASTPAVADQIMQIVRGYLAEGQNAENRLDVLGAAQVNLRVRVAEISRNVTRQLGINWQAIGNLGRLAVNVATNSALADPTNLPAMLGLGYRGAVNADAMIDALAQDGLITVLAEPNLTARSGETASFLVGGEFPIPVAQQNQEISIEFKQFGISLAFVPTVLSAGRISLKVRPEVSALSDQGAVRLAAGNASLQIPALSVRRAETTVEVGSGQSFAIAGLLSDSVKQTDRGLPGLSEVPGVGALFRSDNYQRNETELVIVVTPYLVRPTSSPAALRLPTDGYRPPNDIDRVLLMRQRASAPGNPAPGFPGDTGFVIH